MKMKVKMKMKMKKRRDEDDGEDEMTKAKTKAKTKEGAAPTDRTLRPTARGGAAASRRSPWLQPARTVAGSVARARGVWCAAEALDAAALRSSCCAPLSTARPLGSAALLASSPRRGGRQGRARGAQLPRPRSGRVHLVPRPAAAPSRTRAAFLAPSQQVIGAVNSPTAVLGGTP